MTQSVLSLELDHQPFHSTFCMLWFFLSKQSLLLVLLAFQSEENTSVCTSFGVSNAVNLSGVGVRSLWVADLQDDYLVLLVQKGKIKPVHIVDVPGHARLRPKLDDFLPKACGLVFVVDALDFMPHLRSAAEYILSSSFLPYCL
jgi:hypothetical protein